MSAPQPLRIGTRGSALAMVQAGIVRDGLRAAGHDAELEVIVTEGDVRAPDTAWGEGAFVGAIEAALLEGRVDIAVHSAKDVPTDEDPRLRIAAYTARADPRDVIVLPRTGRAALADLPFGARVGTDSPRRGAFLRAARPDIEVMPIHGNVDTRLRRLDTGEADALVLAAAGLERLGRIDRANVVLEPAVVPPAPGQGALAIQVRAGDARVVDAVGRLDDAPTRLAVELERAILAGAGGGCRAPLGVLALVDDAGVTVEAGYARVEADIVARSRQTGIAGDRASIADGVLADLAAVAAGAALERGWPEVIVARPARQAAATVLALVDAGLAPRLVPAIEIELCPDGELADAIAGAASYDWIVLTSANAVAAVEASARLAGIPVAELAQRGQEGPRWATVGRATARALALAGIRDSVRPPVDAEDAAALAGLMPVAAGDRVLVPRSSLAADTLPDELRRRGATVDAVTAYRTVVGPSSSRRALDAALAGGPVAIVAASPSAVRGLVQLGDAAAAGARLRALPIVVPGATTADAARGAGFSTVHRSDTPGPSDLAAATVRAAAMLQETR